MGRNFLTYGLSFIFLVLFQVIVLNNFETQSNFINPYLYILFILALPFETPKWLLLVLAFVLGITIDAFANSMGMHAAATVLIAFLRPTLLRFMEPRGGYNFGTKPLPNDQGWPWYIPYISISTFIHHFVLFLIEYHRLSAIFQITFQVILSSLFTVILILISQLFFYNQKIK